MKAVFLDKDGTLIQDMPYNVRPELILFESFVFEGLHALQKEYMLVVVSNQAGVAHGHFTTDELNQYWQQFIGELREEGIQIAGYYYCPHHPNGCISEYAIACDCRKPAPGLILQAASELQINLKESWMIGDILNDVEAGHRAGCRAILIDNGNETEWQEGRGRIPDYVAKDFASATEFILKKNVTKHGALEDM